MNLPVYGSLQMPSRVKSIARSRNQAIPNAFVNSTIAILMAWAGFFVRDLLIAGGGFEQHTQICLFLILFNLTLIYMWPWISLKIWAWRFLFIIIASEWVWISSVVSRLYILSDFAVAVPVAFILLFIWRLSLNRLNKWGGTAIFSLLGTIAMGGSIWQGLEDWTLSAAARGKISNDSVLLKFSSSFGAHAPKDLTSPDLGAKDLGRTWSYQGESGPAMWGNLRTEYRACSDGANQSPVDILKHSHLNHDGLKAYSSRDTAGVSKTESALKIDIVGKSSFAFLGEHFLIKSMEVHTPSEHLLSGITYPMEVQFYGENKAGRVSAVAVFVEIGRRNQEFEKILSALNAGNDAQPRKIQSFSPVEILPKELSFFQYNGSLTTPPCSEGIVWNVLHKPVEFSEEQVSSFRNVFPMNARPVQAFGQRSFEALPLKSIAH